MAQQIKQIVLKIPNFAATNPGTTQTIQWTNGLGYPIYVIGGWCWVGASKDGSGDIPVKVSNLTSGDIYLATNWDRYGNSVGAQDNLIPFLGMAGNCYLVNPGDVLEFLLNGTGSYNEAALSVAGTAHINYVMEQP
jgi:hypothetical protein